MAAPHFPKIHIVVLNLLLLSPNLYCQQDKICPQLLPQLESGETSNIIVYFVKGVQPALQRANDLRIADPIERKQAIVQELQTNAESSQSGVRDILSTRSGAGFTSFKSYWLGNKVIVKNADLATALAIAEDPEVLTIRKELIIPAPTFPELATGQRKKRDPENPDLWGLEKIQLEEAWAEAGNRGEGLVVGHIDTGVYVEHEALSESFVGGDYAWFDALALSPVPIDEVGHGTHTLGTLLGGKGIGVAPGAKWMSCRACNETCDGLHDCIQWMTCPTKADGSDPDCSKAPLVINNSWGGGHGEEHNDMWKDEMLAWREMGVIPVFGIGNGYNYCNNTASPGQLPSVIAVGASDRNDYLSIISCLGYAVDGGIKPDLVAPGQEILSSMPPGILAAFNVTDDPNLIYFAVHGTSCACPHVTGIVALMKVRDPDLTYEQAYQFLTENTEQAITLNPDEQFGWICREHDETVFPNNNVGYGRLNALKTLQAQTQFLNGKKRK